jgi:hypothetical protein
MVSKVMEKLGFNDPRNKTCFFALVFFIFFLLIHLILCGWPCRFKISMLK